jgi:hypothetical protein
MNTSTILVLIASFSILLTGAYVWRLTGNYIVLINTTLASFGLLFAAQQLSVRSPGALFASLFCTMLLSGRFVGTWLRQRRERTFGLPAQLVGVTAALALAATITAYCTLFRGA